jgi:hypothetical protein
MSDEARYRDLKAELLWNFVVFSVTVFLVAVAAVSLGLNLVFNARASLENVGCRQHADAAPIQCSTLAFCSSRATASFDVLWLYGDYFTCDHVNVTRDDWVNYASTFYNTIWHRNMFILNMVNGIDRLYNTIWLVRQLVELRSLSWRRRAVGGAVACVGGVSVFVVYPAVVLFSSYQSENLMYTQGKLRLGSEWVAILVLASVFTVVFTFAFGCLVCSRRAATSTGYEGLAQSSLEQL